MKLSISLGKPKAAAAPSKPLPKPSIFAGADDAEMEEPTTAPPVSAYKAEASKAMRKRMEMEKQVDSTVYEYDEVWESMQVAKQKQKEIKQLESAERKPKYINNLLAAAATRKLDHLRAEEKLMQREREMEGDEFKDKEAFVTQAYKDQLAQIRAAEEEEKKREELEKKNRGPTTGMTHFYRKMLEESEQEHEATVAATEKKVYGPQGPNPNLTITKPPDFQPKSDLELAKLAREQGKDVELNDDNQIVDKRELLAAGLNLSLPNTRNLLLQKAQAKRGSEDQGDVQIHTAVGTAASKREINERRRREIQRQMEEERAREVETKKAAEEESLRRTVAKRNTEVDVQSARERYLARKRQRVEEQKDEAPES